MNAVETLEAAITKLETLKTNSQGKYWYRSIGGISAYGAEFGASPESIVFTQDGERSAYSPQMTSLDADLIVTLHRTVDAQLVILREVIAARHVETNWPTLVYTEAALVLAHAILEES